MGRLRRSVGWMLAGMTVLAVGAVGMFALWRARTTSSDPPAATAEADAPSSAHSADSPDRFAEVRGAMLEDDLRGRDITDERVLRAMAEVPRHEFVSPAYADLAYADRPLPIGYEQTISQPYIVALMTQLAQPSPDSRALDIGTGSGYQAAVLATLCREVYSIEIVEPLADEARERLERLGYDNVVVRHGDGYRGWPEHAPFDVIIVAAAPDHIPQPLLDQLTPGGRLVIPVGEFHQELLVVEKEQDGTLRPRSMVPVRFVPMTGEAQRP